MDKNWQLSYNSFRIMVCVFQPWTGEIHQLKAHFANFLGFQSRSIKE